MGRILAHYKVLEKLGSGGMGQVYVAEDTKLSRKIALKVLPPDMASPERLMRFEREAKAVAALDHPNIVTIHSVEEADGVHFITMQLVRGKTLTELLSKKALPLNELFEIAMPLADAVSAAHEKGIIHRDLKPDNLMLTDDSRLMILDFGLAKLKQEFAEEGLSELPTQSPTQEGRILGTVAYMSPEQAEGKQIDHRSDIFSIGIIIYEMATGRRPFQGDTTASMLSSILRDTPTSATELNPELPRDLGRIIKRCFSKDPTRRYQTALDVRNELEELKASVDSGEVSEGVLPQQYTKGKTWLFAAIAAVLAVALAATLMYFLRQADEGVLRLTNPVQVTSAVGVEIYPTWSPEGRTLAYQSNQSGNWDIWVSQVGGAESVNLTADHKGRDGFPCWSPDGSQIAFVSERDGQGVYLMSELGGHSRKVLSLTSAAYNRGPQWSADGTEIACPGFDGEQCFVDIVTLSNLETRRVLLPSHKGLDCWHLNWSSNGRYFAYVVTPDGIGADITQIWVHSVSSGEATSVTDGWTSDWSPIWSADGQKLFFVSNRGGTTDLWQQRMTEDGKPEDDPEPISAGLVMRGAALSPDGNKIAYSRYRQLANIWRVPILQDRPATWADAEQLTFDEAHIEAFDLSPDGKRLIIGSDRNGNDDLWLMPSEGGEMVQLTTDPTPDWGPHWSPDGKEIVFYAYRSGNRDIWIMPAGGGPARQVTHNESFDMHPTWSPDGREIAFNSGRSGNWDIWIMPAEGGEPKQVTIDQGDDAFPIYSPDGSWFVFWSYRDGVGGIWKIPSAGGQAEFVTEGRSPAWSPDGKQLYFRRAGNFWALSVEDGIEYLLTKFEGRRGSLSRQMTDGLYLYFRWIEDVGDIWVMDLVRE